MFADEKIAVQRERDFRDRLRHLTYEHLRDAPMTLHFKMAARSWPCGVREKKREEAEGEREREERKKAAIADNVVFFLKYVNP